MAKLNQATGRGSLRVLHTSDWHLGAKLYQASRRDEQRAFLNWLLEKLEEYRVQVLTVSGDVFDAPVPPADAEQLYYQFLAAAAKIKGLWKIVIVGGNHDSGARLDAPQDVLTALRIHTVGGWSHPQMDRYVCPIVEPEGGKVRGVVLAVPFIHEFHLGVRITREPTHERSTNLRNAFGDFYKNLVDIVKRQWPDVPLVATGHMTCAGTQFGDFKSFIHGWTNAEESLAPDIFDSRIDYVGLGHIHRPFAVDEMSPHPRVWYSGAPIPLRFDEINWKQRVLLVDLSLGKPPAVTSLETPRTRPLIKLDGSVERIESDLLRMKNTATSGVPPLVFIDVHVQQAQPSLDARLHALLSDLPEHRRPTVLYIRQQKINDSGHAQTVQQPPTESLHDLDPEKVFLRLYSTRFPGEAPSPEVLKDFRSLCNPLPSPNQPHLATNPLPLASLPAVTDAPPKAPTASTKRRGRPAKNPV